MLIDTHAHLDDEKFKDDMGEVIKRAIGNGVSEIITVSSTPGSIQRTIEIVNTFESVYGGGGLPPHYAKNFQKQN